MTGGSCLTMGLQVSGCTTVVHPARTRGERCVINQVENVGLVHPVVERLLGNEKNRKTEADDGRETD